MGFWELVLVLVFLPVIIWLAVMVDKKSDWDERYEDIENDEVRPLLGVVTPKKEEKEEK
jgi:hypothetical protein